MNERSAEVEQEPTAQANNDQLLLVSGSLATELNAKKADLNGALILYGLYRWQRMPVRRFGYEPRINGQRACFRSLSELRGQYPWLSEEGIRKILKRAAKVFKGNFIIDLENPGAVGGKSHFWLSPALIKRFGFNKVKNAGFLSVSCSDAFQYGVLESILLQNLRYVTSPERNADPLCDEEGRIYRELSATKLTRPQSTGARILPVSRQLVCGALGTLVKAGAIKKHPSRRGFFTVTAGSKSVETGVTKVASAVNRVARRVNRVARRFEGIDRKPCASNGLQPFAETSNSNTSRNPNRKCIFPSPVSLRSTAHGEAGGLSAGGKKLTMLISDHLEASRQSKAGSPRGDTMDCYKVFRVTDYDKAEFAGYDLPYDFIGLEWYSGKPYSRQAEIEHFMEEMILEFCVNELPFTKQDLAKLRELFVNHPGLTPEHLLPLLHRKPWDICGEYINPPKKGHDQWYWSRRVTNLKQFFRYLPQLAREYHVSDAYGIAGTEFHSLYAEDFRPLFDFSGMPTSLLEVAFENETKLPVTYDEVKNEDGDYVQRPIYYPEFAGLPTIDHVSVENTPMASDLFAQVA